MIITIRSEHFTARVILDTLIKIFDKNEIEVQSIQMTRCQHDELVRILQLNSLRQSKSRMGITLDVYHGCPIIIKD